ncbi:MAG: hypothetical protein IT320_20970 [Anaerolineae bacterium]|nr:hypothetical protein [Anaerolineae bacterium]
MTNEQKIIATKLGLLKLAETLGNVSEACKVMSVTHSPISTYLLSVLQRDNLHLGRPQQPGIFAPITR